MPLLGTGLLAVWNDIAPDDEAQFEAWYRGEHLAERVGLPGFLRGRRYRALDGETEPQFGAVYETESPEVLASDRYLARLDDPTPMTSRMIAKFKNTHRTVLRVEASVGRGVGGALAVVRPSPQGGEAERFAKWISERALPALADAAGVVGAHFAGVETALTSSDNAEGRARGTPDQLDDRLLLIEATGKGQAEHAIAGVLTDEALAANGAMPSLPVGLYAMIHSLSSIDL